MEQKTTVYVKLDTDREVRVELTHVTEGFGTPFEDVRERGLSVRELNHTAKRLYAGDFTTESNF